MTKKLFIAKTRNETIHFDVDGRIYEFNKLTNSYIETDKFVYLDYFDTKLQLLAPEYFLVGWREPIELDATYEIYDA